MKCFQPLRATKYQFFYIISWAYKHPYRVAVVFYIKMVFIYKALLPLYKPKNIPKNIIPLLHLDWRDL